MVPIETTEPSGTKRKALLIMGGIVFLALIMFPVLAIIKPGKSANELADRTRYLDDGQRLSEGACEGEDKPKLSQLPMNETDFSFILPYGMVIDNHITPIDHQYFHPTVFQSAVNAYPVYAMADAKLVTIEKRANPSGVDEYRLVFAMSCKLFYYYDLVTGLIPEIETKMEGREYVRLDYSVRAGQQIGWIGGRTLDFAVWDMDVTLAGLLNPIQYGSEPWKIHTADPLPYYTDDLKAKILPKYLRTVEPVSGRIDYDTDGKLIGNWFLEGTDGSMNNVSTDREKRDLSIAPDFLDPKSYVFSIGDYEGKYAQFGLNNNSPDPAEVGTSNGMNKYELVRRRWVDENGETWDMLSPAKGLESANTNEAVGVALLQMIEGRKLKLELFPNKTSREVNNFTSSARIYER